jgi:meiotically up-regulated gene 157 (Mug157) protein
MHEAFNKDDPSKFTRPWFAWANTMFGELILDLAARRPQLLA